MIWIIFNVLFLAAGIILITASDYFSMNQQDHFGDILEATCCFFGFCFVVVSILSEGIRRYPFG